MPELPEVECVRQGLDLLIGLKIKAIETSQHSMLDQNSLSLNNLKQQVLLATHRQGKYLLLSFEKHSVLMHLGMSGVLLANKPKRPHTHIHFIFSDQNTLSYSDPRRFGYWNVQSKDFTFARWEALGPDSISQKFTAKYLYEKTNSSSREIKVLLLDQKVTAGIGNIYASEILWAAKISPFRMGSSLTLEELKKICKHTKIILKKSISNRGTTFSDYRLTNGKGGAFQSFLKVFQKEGSECTECKSPIIKKTQAQRSTFYCSQCQL
jgi:formamidopyrimidine-DNA glycosylase